MKTNKAPEKIYLHPDLDSIFGITERSCESEIEYTHTDAFIKKACKFLLNEANIPLWEDNSTFGCDTTKLIEDFRNYMKGE